MTEQGRTEESKKTHPVMAVIASTWTNFGLGKSAAQKRQMIDDWETVLSDIPEPLQTKAIRAKAKAGQLWPPSSPAEVRKWCDEIQKPMNGMDAAWYQSCIDTGVVDDDFCRSQIAGYEAAKAAGRVYYAGWD